MGLIQERWSHTSIKYSKYPHGRGLGYNPNNKPFCMSGLQLEKIFDIFNNLLQPL